MKQGQAHPEEKASEYEGSLWKKKPIGISIK